MIMALVPKAVPVDADVLPGWEDAVQTTVEAVQPVSPLDQALLNAITTKSISLGSVMFMCLAVLVYWYRRNRRNNPD